MTTEATWFRLRERCARYLRIEHGVHDNDDLVSEMMLLAMERRGGTNLNLRLCYLQALDRLDPRHVQPGHGRPRDSARTLLASQWHRDPEASPHVDVLEAGARLWQEGYRSMAQAREHVAQAEQEQHRFIELSRRHPTGMLRAMLLLVLVYGWHQHEVAALFGVVESRINQLLGDGRAEVLAYGAPEGEREMPVPDLEVQWLEL